MRKDYGGLLDRARQIANLGLEIMTQLAGVPMPLYEYQCPKCEKVFDVIQKFSDAPLEKCEECGGPVSKMISMSSFALKGTGWYTTDYKRSSGPAKSTPAAAPSAAVPASIPTASPAASAAPAAATPAKTST
jgi:putative FmdB family regulatory protein